MIRFRTRENSRIQSGDAAHFQHLDNQKKNKKDPRITTSRFSWKEFLIMWIAMMILGIGALLILAEYDSSLQLGFLAILSTLSYFGLMSLLFVLLTMLWRQFVFERPIRLLGAAARDVAQGNFNVRLPSLHKKMKKNYLDVMFEDFNAMVEELNSIETLKDDFVGNVSHEIKTPLATIANYASSLRKQDLAEEERAEYAEVISDAAAQLSTLVTNILRLNKLENQGILPESSPFDLSEQLRDCVLRFEPHWTERDIAIEVDIDEVCIVNKDRDLLELVWNNLISNALKFTDSKGTVRITLRADAAHIRVEISDTGIGMDETTQRRMFDKFFQGDSSHSQEGNGLGLTLVSRALRLTGDEIQILSTPGEGSIFTVWIKNQ